MELKFIPIFLAFPPSQAPLNYGWNLSKCIYNVPCSASVNSTWQFPDEAMIWTWMSQCACCWFIEQHWFWSLRRLAFLLCWLRWAALAIKWETGFSRSVLSMSCQLYKNLLKVNIYCRKELIFKLQLLINNCKMITLFEDIAISNI